LKKKKKKEEEEEEEEEVKGKLVDFVLEQATKAQKGSRCTALLFL
jgi:hypothetical protein